ncbi:MAG TPA: response regulator, partial [Vicinamibacteria bacterium]|nr:response regulator [Vicinamibacteria bacterium]
MDQPLASPPAGPGPPQEKPATLLVVDDNDLIRELLTVFFGQRGYTVLEAENGPEALAMVASHAVDLVLLDVMMPEVSGLDVLQELRLLREPSDLPIIMITAKDRTDDVVGALNMGANDYIVKPLDLPEVVARV